MKILSAAIYPKYEDIMIHHCAYSKIKKKVHFYYRVRCLKRAHPMANIANRDQNACLEVFRSPIVILKLKDNPFGRL